MIKSVLTVATLVAAIIHSGTATGQTLYGSDGGAQALWEFTSTPAGPCLAPNPMTIPCNYRVTMCGVTAPGPIAAGSLNGDVAVDCTDDTVYITDGFTFGEYVGDRACSSPPPCTVTNLFRVPLSLLVAGMGPITGMGMDETGTWSGGTRTLYITDGKMIAGIQPPGALCGTASVVYGPCIVTNPNGTPYTDLTWDPLSASLWACDISGFLHQIQSCTVISSFNATAVCGLGTGLTGVAFDLASGRTFSPGGPAFYVTDGANVAYINVGGGPAAATFYTPTNCTAAPAPLNGLAYASHGISYGFPRVTARCGTFGQSCAPGPTFGLEYSGVPQGLLTALFINTSFPGPGYLCPPAPGIGTLFWVDPTGFLIILGPSTPACTTIPLAIPASAPTGLNVFFQFVFVNTSSVAVDSTEGCAFTITAP